MSTVRRRHLSIDPASASPLAARLAQWAYLGGLVELSFDTELGTVFVVSDAVHRAWQVGDTAILALAGHGVAVVPVEG